MFASRDLPGCDQYRVGHVDVLDSALTLITEDSWAARVRPGRKLMVSFVMGVVMGMGIPRSKCPRCRKPYKYTHQSRSPMEWNQW